METEAPMIWTLLGSVLTTSSSRSSFRSVQINGNNNYNTFKNPMSQSTIIEYKEVLGTCDGSHPG